MALRLDFNVSTTGEKSRPDSGEACRFRKAATRSADRPPRSLRQSGEAGIPRANCCSAATAPQADRARTNNLSKINRIDGYYAILTCQDTVSMVRAAFEGGDVISINPRIV